MVDARLRSRSAALAALAVYAALSFIFVDHGASITRNILGISSDPFSFSWFLSWWPWSLAHHINPLYTNLVWQPAGLHIAWSTSVPFLALIAAPITLNWGAVPAYNLLTLAAPVFSAWCAYLLCLRLTGKVMAAAIGGYLYGFSTYEMSETLAHLNLDWNFLLPLVVFVVLERLQDHLSRTKLVFYLTVILVLQFYISVEIFATMIFFAGISWLLANSLLPTLQIPLRRLLWDGFIAAAFVLVFISPLLWPMLLLPRDVVTPAGWSYVSAARLLNLMVPVPETVLGNPGLRYLNDGLFGIPESDVTTGLPVLLSLWLYASKNWRSMRTRFIYILLAIILLASLGPQLWAGPVLTKFVLPWRLMLGVPLIASALPVRFALYASLLVALLVALWVAAPPREATWRRIGAGIIACVLLSPSPHPVTPLPDMTFFAPGYVQESLGFQPRLLILPAEKFDYSALFQARNGFGFSQTTGYLGFPPRSMQSYPAVGDIMFRWKSAHLEQDIAELCLATNTQFVVTGPDTAPELSQAMKELGWPARNIEGMRIFTVEAVAPSHG